MRRTFLFIAGLAVVTLAAGSWVSGWVARRSVPLAVYLTLVPAPFQIEKRYNTGRVQDVEIGGAWHEAVDHLLSKGCTILSEGRMLGGDQRRSVDERAIDQNGRIVVRCHGGGIVWNFGLVVVNDKIQEIRLAGGIWSD